MDTFLTAAFYKFVPLHDFAELKQPILDCCRQHEVKGTILLASEGINGTIAGPESSVRLVLAKLRSDSRLADLQHKEAFATKSPFYRMKVRLKREIVTLGVPGVDPTLMVGTYVQPKDWNRLIDDPEVVVVDVRNDYEVAIGSFRGAVNPHTASFSDFPAWVAENPLMLNKPKVAMYCTGGIRCEKSTAFLRAQGFDEVYHLEGGILKYLETIPEDQSRWTGDCFVFDERVSVGHGLTHGKHEFCRACRHPLAAADKESEHYIHGVSCARCFPTRTPEQKAAAMERQKQVSLAERRNASHIGSPMPLKEKSA
jgi:UPF0176 protein